MSFKKNSHKVGSKGGKSLEGMEGVEYDGIDSEGFDGDVGSSVDAQSLDSRSVGEPMSKKEVDVGSVTGMVSASFNEYVNVDFSSVNMPKTDVVMNTSINIGDIPVPVSENPILTPSVSPSKNPRILKRGEILCDGGVKADAAFSFKKVDKWPSLGNSSKSMSESGVGNTSNEAQVVNDTMMSENIEPAKPLSFANAVQGLSPNGNNRLRLIPVVVNEQGKEVVDLDPLIEKGSKN